MSARYYLRTFGCQMNQHDAEKIGNLLHHQGYLQADRPDAADVILLHTCSVREKAESKLYSELGQVAQLKRARPGVVVGVGGCVAQQEGRGLLERFDSLDFVFGPQNLRHLPAMVGRALARERSLRTDYDDDPQARFDLPERHPDFEGATPGRAFVTVMEGCDLFCTFCVVPMTRGREVSRSSQDIVREVEALAERGVVEVTLLGQTVNAYGRRRPGQAEGEIPFAELVRRVAAVEGIRRVRFTSPHPIFMDADLVRAYAEVPELCPHLHLPVQSGSTRVLRAMNRRYTREQYLGLIGDLRAACPEIVLTTDLIVGFPGETDEDFEQTLSLMREVDFIDSFSFKYSARPGTAATRRELAPVPAEQASERLSRLQALQRSLTLRHHRARVGQSLEVLVTGASRHASRGHGGTQLQGRSPENRIVNFEIPEAGAARPGTLAEVLVTDAQPHSLLGLVAEAQLELPLV